MSRSAIKIRVEHNDVFESRGDVLALKHAQSTFGVDEAGVDRLSAAGVLSTSELPKPSGFHLVPADGTVAATTSLSGPFHFLTLDMKKFVNLGVAL